MRMDDRLTGDLAQARLYGGKERENNVNFNF
jgi:hypothetical protein